MQSSSSHASPQAASSLPPSLSGGLVVVGTTPQCGKTTVVAGLTLALAAMGQRVLPLAPVELDATDDKKITGQFVLNHLCKQAGFPPADFQPVMLSKAGQLSKNQWHHLTSQLGQQPYPVIIDTPMTVALPWGGTQGVNQPAPESLGSATAAYSALRLAADLQWPVLVVTPYSVAGLAMVLPVLQWLNSLALPIQSPIAGWVAVEQSPLGPNAKAEWDDVLPWVTQATQAPYLGALAYGPQVSIPMGYVGELVDRVEMGLDLLPLQLAMGLSLAGF